MRGLGKEERFSNVTSCCTDNGTMLASFIRLIMADRVLNRPVNGGYARVLIIRQVIPCKIACLYFEEWESVAEL